MPERSDGTPGPSRRRVDGLDGDRLGCDMVLDEAQCKTTAVAPLLFGTVDVVAPLADRGVRRTRLHIASGDTPDRGGGMLPSGSIPYYFFDIMT
jgi:hypothetical protein